MLALRNRPARDKTFSQFLTQVKENTLDAYDNQDYQFEKLVKKLNLQGKPARNPLFDVVLQVQNIGTTKLEIPDLTLTYIENENTFVRFDLVVYISEAQDTINMKIAYSTALFKRSTANDIAFHFCEILKQVIDDTAVKLDDITISEQFTEARPAVSQIEVNDFSW
jgi:bacitracin synthase 1/bacitracin synthase 3